MYRSNARKRFGLTLEDVYFCNDIHTFQSKCDISYFYYLHGDVPWHDHSKATYNVLIGLNHSESELIEGIRKSNRHEIRKAMTNETMEIVVNDRPTTKDIDFFLTQYNHFAQTRGIDQERNSFLCDCKDHGFLTLIHVFDLTSGKILCGCADIVTPEGALGDICFSCFRDEDDKIWERKVSQASKLLYWESILNAMHKGCPTLDIGEIAPEKIQNHKGINHFKTGFGGDVQLVHTLYHGNSFIGKVVVLLLKLIHKRFDDWQ